MTKFVYLPLAVVGTAVALGINLWVLAGLLLLATATAIFVAEY